MEARELRIGNYAYKYNNPKVYTIENGIDINGAGFYQPIPLTGEWLVKFGFKGGVKEQGDQLIQVYGNGFFYLFGNDSVTSGQCFTGECKYVHQLQNLYFALTGQELEVKK